jgi:hypothetical protein
MCTLHAGQGEVVLRGFVPRIHVFAAGVKGVDGRVKPGQDEDGAPVPSLLLPQKISRTALRLRGRSEQPIDVSQFIMRRA